MLAKSKIKCSAPQSSQCLLAFSWFEFACVVFIQMLRKEDRLLTCVAHCCYVCRLETDRRQSCMICIESSVLMEIRLYASHACFAFIKYLGCYTRIVRFYIRFGQFSAILGFTVNRTLTVFIFFGFPIRSKETAAFWEV